MTDPTSTDDPWKATRARHDAYAQLHAAGALDDVPCPACGYPTLPKRGGRHICVLCHWQDDSTDGEPDRPSGRNHGLTLREASAHIAETGIAAAKVPEYVTPQARAARTRLVEAYERLRTAPTDTTARAAVRVGRSDVMRAMAAAMR